MTQPKACGCGVIPKVSEERNSIGEWVIGCGVLECYASGMVFNKDRDRAIATWNKYHSKDKQDHFTRTTRVRG